MVDNILKAVAENKIKELEKEVSALERELRDKESFHRAAWAEYGSELCTGEMLAEENKIQIEIIRIRRDIILLRNFIKGDLDISEEDYLQGECSRHNQEIARLNELKSSINARLEVIRAVKNLLAVIF